MEDDATLNMSLGYTAFLLGMGATFVMRRIAAAREISGDAPHRTEPPDASAAARTRGAAIQLRDVAQNMACDVNTHRMLVESVSNRLGASLAADTPDERLILDSTVELLDANFDLQCRLATAEEKIANQAKEINFRQREASTDPLTRLPNRRVFDDQLAKCLADFESANKPFSVIMLDVDFFKQFNDAHGHAAGDEALRVLGQTLPQHLKRSDVVCRVGGEEFAIILRGARVLEAQAAANRLRAAVEAMPIEVDGHSLSITISLGVAEAMPGEDARRIFSRADACVYQSKRVGRNCTHWHNGADCVFATERRAKAFDRGRAVAGRLSRLWRHRGEQRVEEMPIVTDRAVFVSLLQRRVGESARSDEALSVLLFTLPGYETLKQRIGEGEAGRIESQILSAMTAAVRDMDYVGRLREAEYAILLPRCSEADANFVGQRLAAAMASSLSVEGEALNELRPAVAVLPVVHPVTAEQVLDAVRQRQTTSAVG